MKHCKYWKDIENTLGKSRTTLRNYETFHLFLKQFPRFRRLRISYTGLFKAIPAIRAYFKSHALVKCKWQSISKTDGEEVDNDNEESACDKAPSQEIPNY